MHKNIDYRIAMIVIALAWAFVAAWHPAYLGFFSDDWYLFVPDKTTAESILDVTKAYPDYPQILIQNGIDPTLMTQRPGCALLHFVLKPLLNDAPVGWQIASVLLLLGAAYSLFFLVISLAEHLGYSDKERIIGATIATIVYLIGPWSVVMSSWPTVSITLISQIMISFGLRRLMNSQSFFPLSAILLLLFGFFIYEAYWFMFVPVAVLLLVAPDWKRVDHIRFVTISFSIFILAILIKTGLSKLWNIPQKELSTEFFPLFFYNMLTYVSNGEWGIINQAIRPVPSWFFWLSLTMIMISSHYVATDKKRYLQIGCLALAAGLTSSAFLYALAGYGLTGTGVMSRVVAAPNIYFAIFIGFLWAGNVRGLKMNPPHRKQTLLISIFFIGSIGLFSTLMMGTIARSCEWVELWKTEQAVLSRFPYQLVSSDINKMGKDQLTTVVVQIDEDTKGSIFGASYEMAGAVAWKYPILKRAIETKRLTFLVAREAEWSTVWDGDNVVQKWCYTGKNVSTAEAKRVKYVRISRNAGFNYSNYPLNRTTGCLQTLE